MEIFFETLCRFIEARAKTITAHESCGIIDLGLTTEELSDRLTSTQNTLRFSKSRIQVAWECFPYKGLLAFVFLVVLMILSFLTLLYEVWWVGLVGLLSVSFSIVYFLTKDNSTGSKNAWLYIFILKLRLKLWKIPPRDDEKINPRCIFVPWNKHQAGTWGEWLYAIILPKLQSELGITDMKGLDSIIKNAEYSSNEYQSYSLWRDGVMIPRSNLPLWLFLLHGILSPVLFIIGAIYCESYIAKLVSLPGVATVLKMIYGLVQSNKENVEPDVEANGNILDVICRLHRVMENEAIFFAVVAYERDDLNEIPDEHRRYFKFLVNCLVEIPISHPTLFNCIKCDYVFYMDWLLNKEKKDMIVDLVADIIFNGIIYERFIYETEDAEKQFEFLRLLHKINDGNNKIVANRSMLHLVGCSASLSYSVKDPTALGLEFWYSSRMHNMCLTFYTFTHCAASILCFDLRLMELNSTQAKLMLENIKKKFGKKVCFHDNVNIDEFKLAKCEMADYTSD